LIAGATFCGKCGNRVGAPLPPPSLNEQELIAEARAVQAERERWAQMAAMEQERRANERRIKEELLTKARQMTWDYILWWASRFPSLAKQAGLPYYDKKCGFWILYRAVNYWDNLCIDGNGKLWQGDSKRSQLTLDLFPSSFLPSKINIERFSEAIMRRKVDNLFMAALMGSPEAEVYYGD